MDTGPSNLQAMSPDDTQMQHQTSPRQHGQQKNYQFTAQEMIVIKQCNYESFYQRSLPIGTALGLTAYALVNAGYLKKHPRWGATPKITLAVIAGYFMGKLSYQRKCAEKLMALPNSPVGEMLRQRQKKGINETLSLDTGFSTPLSLESFTEARGTQASHLDLDSDRPSNEGLNDSGRPTLDDSSYDEEQIPLPPGGVPTATSYEELRRRNREDFEQQRSRPFGQRSVLDENPPVVRKPNSPQSHVSQGPKNKYGDVWEQ